MAYAELQSYSINNGPHIMFCYVNDITSGLFGILFLTAIWMIATFSHFFIQKRATGSGDFPVSMSLGSFTTLISSILLRLFTCPHNPMINDLTLGVVIGIMALSILFLFFSRD